MSDKQKAVETALEDLKEVARVLHVPLDVSTLEKAIKDAFGASEEKPEEKKDETPSTPPAPRGVNPVR